MNIDTKVVAVSRCEKFHRALCIFLMLFAFPMFVLSEGTLLYLKFLVRLWKEGPGEDCL
jgi:hypothetical protein